MTSYNRNKAFLKPVWKTSDPRWRVEGAGDGLGETREGERERDVLVLVVDKLMLMMIA